MARPATQFSRRTFFRGATLLLTGVLVAPALVACTSHDQPEPRGYDGAPRPLPVPPLAEGELVDGVRHFHLDTGPATAELLPGQPTAVWGFNGSHLGPTLRARSGEDVAVEIGNSLDEMTTIHWHGMRLPAWADGGPHSPIEPGHSWQPEWTIDQPAGTLWYHPHPHERTALHCYRGLAGMFLLDDEVADGLDLPADYGVDDIPLIVTDHKFHEDGSLDETIDPTFGLMGDTPLVNGVTNASFDATTRRVRLRLLNAAGMRFYNFALSDGRPFHVIASDVGLLGAPEQVDSLILSPGERAEILVDLQAGEEVTLRSVAFPDSFGIPEDEYSPDFGFRDEFELLRITGPGEGAPAVGEVPAVLDPAADVVPDTAGAPHRDFVLNTFEINGQLMDMNRVDFIIDHDGPEIWTATNENPDWPHNFHIHNAAFRVLAIDGTGVEVPTSGWKDTVALPPGSTATLAVTFGRYPDNTVPYMFHCHMLFHEDQGMMGQFMVVNPGEGAELEPMAGHAS